MEDSLKQALADFELFLSGARAPALVGHSLAAVVDQDVRVVAGAVSRWVYGRHKGPDRFDAIVAARNKVFDVFFYRVVRFQRIYDFFPPFERALVRSVPRADQERVSVLLERFPWREIRPLGSFRDPQEFALEGRADRNVSADRFNEDLYRNATHQILSADRRYTFDSESERLAVGQFQTEVAGVFEEFVELIADPRTKREIKLANAADADAVYTNKPRFQLEVFVCQLADLAVALHNDEFFVHAIKVFDILRRLTAEHRASPGQLHRLQEKAALFNLQKTGEYAATKTGAFLLRDVLRLFVKWHPERLLQVLRESEDRRERKLTLAMLEAYGGDVYPLVVDTLGAARSSAPWFFVRNLLHVLGRVATDDDELRDTAADLAAEQLAPGSMRQVNHQAIQALGFIATDRAARALVNKLGAFGESYKRDREATDAAHKIVAALIAIESEEAMEAAFAFCERHELLGRFRDQFNRATMPPRLRAELVSRVRRDVRKLRFSFKLLGDAITTREILEVVGQSGQKDVEAICNEILRGFPARDELAQAAARVMAVPPLPPMLSPDRTLHRLLVARDLPQAFCHLYDSGGTGRVEVETRDGVEAEIEFASGEVVNASVPRYFIAGDNAFEWTLLLDGREIERLDYDAAAAPPVKRTTSPETPRLLREALLQRGETEQILDGFLAPEARYRRREVPEFYTRFTRVDEPARYRAVWDAIEGEADLKAIQLATRLSRYEVCKILFYLLKRNMVEAIDRAGDAAPAGLDDALSAIALAVEQIEARPVTFQNYYAAAEACAYVRRTVADEAIRTAARGLRNFFLDAYSAHRVFVAKHVEICSTTLAMMGRYMRGRAEADRRELLDFVAFAFGEPAEPAGPAPAGDAAPAASAAERLENIDGANDPFDAAEGLFGDASLEEIFAAVDSITAAAAPDPSRAGSAALSAGEESMLVELFGNIANAYAKPFKAFVRELDANHKRRRETSAEWLDFALPSVSMLADASAKLENERLHAVFARVAKIIEEQRAAAVAGEPLPRLFCERVLVEHHHLAKLLPSTFSLEPSEEELASRKEGLVVKFILRQLPEVDELTLNKILFAGLGSFDRFMEVPAEEIAQVTGISKGLAETIYMKFYQYRDLYYHHAEPAKAAKLVELFEISLAALKELHAEVERLARDERARKEADPAARKRAVADRQRTLWSLFTLLCIKGEHDLVERVQVAVYEDRIAALDEYFVRIAEASSVATA